MEGVDGGVVDALEAGVGSEGGVGVFASEVEGEGEVIADGAVESLCVLGDALV